MANYPVRGIIKDDYMRLRIEAARRGVSINRLILTIIQEFLKSCKK